MSDQRSETLSEASKATLSKLAEEGATLLTFFRLAADPSTSADLLLHFTQSHDAALRYAVAGNPSTSSSSLAMLALDYDSRVSDAARNNMTFRTAYDAKRVELPLTGVPDLFADPIILAALGA